MHRRKVIQHISFRGAAPNPAGGASAHPRTPSLTFIVSPGCQPIISPAVKKFNLGTLYLCLFRIHRFPFLIKFYSFIIISVLLVKFLLILHE